MICVRFSLHPLIHCLTGMAAVFKSRRIASYGWSSSVPGGHDMHCMIVTRAVRSIYSTASRVGCARKKNKIKS